MVYFLQKDDNQKYVNVSVRNEINLTKNMVFLLFTYLNIIFMGTKSKYTCDLSK